MHDQVLYQSRRHEREKERKRGEEREGGKKERDRGHRKMQRLGHYGIKAQVITLRNNHGYNLPLITFHLWLSEVTEFYRSSVFPPVYRGWQCQHYIFDLEIKGICPNHSAHTRCSIYGNSYLTIFPVIV